jgi:hypothetical protein
VESEQAMAESALSYLQTQMGPTLAAK